MDFPHKFCCLALLIVFETYGMPSNPQVIHGDARFENESGEVLKIFTSEPSSINWDEFSLLEGEKAIFFQPNSKSVILNRVIGQCSSEILGTIQSNGQVLLMNPNGLLIGRNAQINTASFVASTLDIHQRTFEETGLLHFTPTSQAYVQNFGSIRSTGGAALLIGSRVENYGELFANDGFAGLFAVNGGELNLSSQTFNQTHSIEGTRCVHAGSVHSAQTGGIGGTASFIGNEIHFESKSAVDVSGDNGGGAIWIGAFKKEFSIPSSQAVQIDKGALIQADALNEGNGGTVFIFSSHINNYYGFTSAKGGMISGNGGRIEISAPLLAFEGTIDLTDSKGNAGYLILDPLDVTIAGANLNVTGASPFTPTGLGATLNAATVTAALAAGNVIITTVGTPAGGNGDVFVNSPLVWASNFSLTIDSARDINIANTGDVLCQGLGNGSITLQAVRNISVLADVRNANSAAGAGVSGNVTLTSATGNIVVGSAAQVRNVSVCARKGTTTVTANTGNISIIAGAAVNSFSTIGEPTQAPIGVVGTAPVASGPINVSCLGNLTMTAGTLSRASSYIGKGGNFINAGITGVNRDINSTDITVTVGGNMNMTSGPAPATGGPDCYIANGGYQSASPPFLRRNGNISVNVHGNLYMRSGGTFCYIGLGSAASVANGNGTILLRVGGNMTLDGTVGSASTVAIFTFGDPPLNHNWNVTAYIGGNLTLDGRNSQSLFRTFNYLQVPAIPPGYTVHVGGEVNIIAGGRTANFQNASPAFGIAPNFLWEIWAGGRIRAYNGSEPLNRGGTIFLALGGVYDTVDIRSASDIVQAGGETNAVSFVSTRGPLSLQSDYPFTAAQLWTPQSAIVNGVNVFTGTPLGAASPAIPSDGIGAVAFDMNDYVISQVTFPPSPNGVFPPLFPTPSAAPALSATYNFPSVFISSADVFSNGTPADFLNIGTAPGSVRFLSSNTDITITGHRNIQITNASITSARDALIIAQNDMTLNNATVSVNRNADLVVDNSSPISPLIGPGSFSMNAASSISALTGYIRVYTALQGQNNIDPAAQFISAGSPFLFIPGTLFQDTNQEQWCTYYPGGSLGVPFRIFYKNCLQIVLEQAQLVVSEVLFEFSADPNFPYYGLNDYLNWPTKFFINYDFAEDNPPSEPYFINRGNDLLVHPARDKDRALRWSFE